MVGFVNRIGSALSTMLGFPGTESTGRRRLVPSTLRSEDSELTPIKRRRQIANARDLNHSFALVAWAIRKHLDYVSTFSLQVKANNDALSDLIEAKMAAWSLAENCDIARRHPLRRFIRLSEARRTVDGDIGILRLAAGKIQAIEGDRIRTPEGGLPAGIGVTGDRLRHGVAVDRYGAALGYSICRRNSGSDYVPGSGGFQFERLVSPRHFYLHGYFERFDQVRGISAISSSLDTFRDTHEGIGYALAKLKVAQLFGLVTTRAGDEDLGQTTPPDDDDEDETSTEYKVDFGAGPFHLDLDPGDDAKFLENKTPSMEAQQFLQFISALSLKAIDIPYSFYAENFSNYSGSRQALLQYEQSASVKRADNRDLLNWITHWRIWLWWINGELGEVSPEDFASISCSWIPTGLPWIDPLKEVQADIAACDKGFTSPQRVCRERGMDWYEIQDERKEAVEYLKKHGIESVSTVVPVTINEQAVANA